MTESERQEIKASLIELVFWRVSEEGDPTDSERAARLVMGRIETRLAAGFFLQIWFADEKLTAREVRVAGRGTDRRLAIGEDLALTICRAALALAEFLKQHPECAARPKRRPK
jgi:hypothetical protein